MLALCHCAGGVTCTPLLEGTMKAGLQKDPDLKYRWCAPSSLDGINILLNVSRLDAGIVQPRLKDFFTRNTSTEIRSLTGNRRLMLRVRPTISIIRSDPTVLERDTAPERLQAAEVIGYRLPHKPMSS